jgi:uncharacterized ferredoxin-like protein
MFEVSSSLSIIQCNASPVRKADGIIILGLRIILAGSKFEVSSSLSVIPRFILHNAASVRKADGIIILGV